MGGNYKQDGYGIIIQRYLQFDFSAWSFSIQDLEQARHMNEIPKTDFYTLNIDYRQMRVGGDDSWGTRTHKEYYLPPQFNEFKFVIQVYFTDQKTGVPTNRTINYDRYL